MSSNFLFSSQNLWRILKNLLTDLENGNHAKYSPEINLHRDVIFKNVSVFKPRKEPVDDDKSKLKKEKVVDEVVTFVDTLSSLLNLNFLQAHDIFFCYLLREYSGEKRQIKHLVTEERSKKWLISSVEQFYLQEQVHILKCLTLLVKVYLRLSGEELFADRKTSEKIFCLDFFVSVIRDFTKLRGNLNLQKDKHQSQPKRRQLILNYYSQKEELIKMLIWAVHSFDSSLQSVIEVLECFTELNSYEQSNVNKFLSSDELSAVTSRIDCLKLMLVAEIFDLELLFHLYQNSSEIGQNASNTKCLWLRNNNVAELEECVLRFTKTFDEQYVGGVYLFWCLNLQIRKLLSENLSDDAKLAKYSVLAKQFNAFDVCSNVLTSTSVVLDNDLCEIVWSIIYNLVDVCFNFFEPDSLSDQNVVVNILTTALKQENVAGDFWSNGFTSGISQYVRDEIFYNFPYSVGNMLKLSSSLCAASEESCSKFLEMFGKFSLFCEAIPTFDRNEFEPVGENVYRCLRDRRPYATDDLIIPSGCVGQLIEVPAEGLFIRWRVYVDGWKILLIELTKNPLENGKSVFPLIDSILSVDAGSATLFTNFYAKAADILKMSSLQIFDDVSVLSSCISCLSRAAEKYPTEILSLLNTFQFFPASNVENMSWTNLDCGLIGNVNNDYELIYGDYKFCEQYLQLIHNFLKSEILLDNENVFSSVAYVLARVFPVYQSWNYVDEKMKDSIGHWCLKIFQKCLESFGYPRKSAKFKLRRVSKLVVDSFMFGEARCNLIKIASVGPDVLRGLFRIADAENDAYRASEMVARSISIIARLLDIANELGKSWSSTSKNLPPLFATFFQTSGDRSFVSVLGQYLIFAVYDKLPRLALLCLEKIAETFPSSLLSAFGENVDGFCDLFLNRLESPYEGWLLKLACVNFFSVCIRNQAGLAERLTCSVTSAGGGDANFAENGGLKLIFELLRTNNVQPELFSSCLRLFTTLWRCKWTESVKTLKTTFADFWRVVSSPLAASEEEFFLKMCAEVLDLLTLDMYYFAGKFSVETSASSWKIVEKLLKSDRVEMIFVKFTEFFESSCELSEKLSVFKCWCNFIDVALTLGDSLFDEFLTFDLIRHAVKLQLRLLEESADGHVALIESTGCFYLSLIKYASLNFATSIHWLPVGELFGRIIELIGVSSMEEHFPIICMSPLFGSLTILLSEKRRFVEKLSFISSIFNSLCSIFNKLMQLRVESKDESVKTFIPNALDLTTGCISASIRRTDSSIWLPSLKKYCVLPNIISLFSCRLNFPNDSRLFASFVNIFCVLAEYNDSLGVLQTSGFCDFVCSKLPSTWPFVVLCEEKIIGSLLSFFTSALVHLEFRYVDEATTFVCSWEDALILTLRRVFDEPTKENLRLAHRICIFLRCFARYQNRWVQKHVRLRDVVTTLISRLSMRLIAYLAKPAFIKYVSIKGKSNETDVAALQSSHRIEVQQQFFEILFVCAQVLLEFSPNLEEIQWNYNFDADSFKPLCTLEFSTNLNPEDEETSLTFGGLLLCGIICVNCLRKIDGIKSTSPSVHRSTTLSFPLLSHIEKITLVRLLESTIYLCVSQGFLQLNYLQQMDGEKALVKRELGTELDLILSKCGRTAGSPSTPRKSPAGALSVSPASVLTSSFDQNFVKLSREYVQVLFKT